VNQLRDVVGTGDPVRVTQSNFETLDLALSASTIEFSVAPDLDFAGSVLQTIDLTDDVTFTTSNKGAGRALTVRINSDSSVRALAFPAGWVFVGAAAPVSIAADKTALLRLYCYGTADTDVVARYEVQS
jgi:hypothetical protein